MQIAICLPIHSGAEPKFVEALGRMIARTYAANIQVDGKRVPVAIDTMVYSTSNIAFSRRKLADRALEWGADWLLWIDADQVFPSDTLVRLLARGRQIIGANIRRRDVDTVKPTAFTIEDGKFIPHFPEGDGVEEVAHLGFGVCLTHADVFRRIERPFFVDELRPNGDIIGEDVNFCRKARAAEFRSSSTMPCPSRSVISPIRFLPSRADARRVPPGGRATFGKGMKRCQKSPEAFGAITLADPRLGPSRAISVRSCPSRYLVPPRS